jgi:hypothetical protein
MRAADQERLASIAADLAERRAVDWEALRHMTPDLAPVIRQLALLDRIAERHARADLPPGVADSGPTGPIP